MLNSQDFLGLCPQTPWGGFTGPPRPSSCDAVFLLATIVEKPASPKNIWISHGLDIVLSNFQISTFCQYCKNDQKLSETFTFNAGAASIANKV